MQAVTFHAAKDIRIEDVEPDEVGSNEVRVDVDSCGICGTDLHEYAAGPIFIPDQPHPVSGAEAPVTMGHEFSGVVSEVGADVTDLSAGDAVAINPILYCGECTQCEAGNYHLCQSLGFTGLASNGGFADNVVVPAEQAIPLGDVPLEYGALVEPLAVALHAVRVSGLQAGDTVGVFGSGPIGLSVIQAARAAGAARIFVSEPRAARRDMAEDCGAHVLVDPTAEDPVEVMHEAVGGVDVAFEVSSIEQAYQQAIEATAPTGTVTVVSIWEEEASAHLNNVVLGERQVVGSIAYLGGPRSDEEFGMVIDMIDDGVFDPEALITDRIGMGNIVQEGFERLLDPDSDQVKILVKPE
jgi:(R,R)-butanediol dehydrogenase/meso-butanediol dehydrogenase/diacetyl reductase